MIEALGIVAAGFTAGALLDRDGRRRAVWVAASLLVALVLLLLDQWDSAPVEALRDSPLRAVALAVVGLLVVVGLAWLFDRHSVAFPIAAVVALPFRVPLELGGETANLLVPLYAVVAGGALAWLAREAKGDSGVIRAADDPEPGRWARLMTPLLAASVVLYAVAIIWSSNPERGLQDLCFFLIPFAALFALLLEVRWDKRTLRLVFIVLVVQALLCAAVGFGQYLTRELFWNEAVIRTNDFHVYFRVNSLFWDPNIYGRYLALVITVVVAVIAWVRNRNAALWLSGVAFVLWLALVITFSQSSFLALIAGIGAVIALRWNLRAVLAGLAAVVALGVAFLAVGGGVLKFDFDRLNPQTGGRANLVTGGLELFADRPFIGFGAGSFAVAFQEEVAGLDAPVAESHTEPITVAAETGIVGLAIYIALVVSSLFALLAGFRTAMPGISRNGEGGESGRGPPVARAAIFAAYLGLLVHTIFYAGYLNDPATWVLLAVGYSLAFRCRAT
ncbi:MAG: O-antigen ligase family protein [Solirubrobacterales bacterium]